MTDSKQVSIQVLSPTQQIAVLRDMVNVLAGQGSLNQGQANSLLKKLVHAQSAITQGKPQEAYNLIGAFRNELEALTAGGVLTPAQSEPLIDAAELLLQSLKIGGGF